MLSINVFYFPAPTMIIDADFLVPYLKDRVRPLQRDASRHLLCAHCAKRTKLDTLPDGWRKCTVCGRKFCVNKTVEKNKLQQSAEILLCFCLGFSPHKATQFTHHRYRLVLAYYDYFLQLSEREGSAQALHNKALAPDLQARKIIDLMPMNFLTSWFLNA